MCEKSFIGGYWKERPESLNDATNKIKAFLENLQSIDELFSNFKLQANSKKVAMETFFEVQSSSILSELIKSRKKNEIDSEGFCDIGFRFNVFNEFDELSFVISCTIGGSNKYVSNVCYVDVKGKVFDEKTTSKIQNLIEEIFAPTTMRIET